MQTFGPRTQSNLSVQKQIENAIGKLREDAPALLDTITELAAAFGNDPNYATSVATALSQRLRFDVVQNLTKDQKLFVRKNADMSALLTGLASPPPNSLGIDGDFYLHKDSAILYGPKANGQWPTDAFVMKSTKDSGINLNTTRAYYYGASS